jgi:SAM-dependent methyltransferase
VITPDEKPKRGSENADARTVAGFGDEWRRFDQAELEEGEVSALFESYFHIFPWSSLPPAPTGFDLGSGSGRWAKRVAKRVGHLHCIDASSEALSVARENLRDQTNVTFHHASVDSIPLADGSMDFGFSLGVLHHVPDTQQGLRDCVAKLKPGAPFLLYLYYAFDNRPRWFRQIWRVSDLGRRVISRLPLPLRFVTSQAIAATVYFPLARGAAIAERLGANVANFPVSFYRHRSFYVMRTDALDRFGTSLERRFSRDEIRAMMTTAGLENIRFSETSPFWCAVGEKR